MSDRPCLNPNCSSQGRPHPHCHCYMAKGGTVCDLKMPHKPGCEYYADGGEVEAAPQPAHPAVALGHSAIQHGLLGLLTDVGNESLAEPDKHKKKFEKVRSHMSMNDPDGAINELHGSPLAGGASRNALEPIAHRLAPAAVTREPHPAAFRASVDYLNSAIRGHNALDSHMNTFFDPQKVSDQIKPDEKSRKSLDEFLLEARENPNTLLDVGGSLGHYLPEHAAQLGATAAMATEYLNSLRPTKTQNGPLDTPTQPDQNAEANFHRQLDLAQNPMLVLQRVRNGMLLPKDVKTVQTLYPALYKSMTEKMTEAIVDAQAKKKTIPYRQRVAMSMFLGQPMDSTMSPSSMQAIIQSQAQQQIQNQSSGQKKSQSKPTAAELKQIDKVDGMYATPEQSRQLNRK